MVQSLPRSDSFRILFNSPELSEVQRSGFHFFLKKGIAEELSKISCISIKNLHFLVEILVDAPNFRLVAPENNYRDCILKMKSYTCKLYVQTKILFKDKVSGELLYQTQPEWVLLADLPMMTKRGHFVINGSPRIVVHQVGRAPGVYFKKVIKVRNDVNNKARFYGDIIPRKGVWVRLQINKKGEIDLKLKKSKKVRAEMVQKCLQLLEKEAQTKPHFVTANDASVFTNNNKANAHVQNQTFTRFLNNVNGSLNFKTFQPRFGKALLSLDSNACVRKRTVQSFVVGRTQKASFSALTKAEKEAFADVYTSFYKNEIQDIEERVKAGHKTKFLIPKPKKATGYKQKRSKPKALLLVRSRNVQNLQVLRTKRSFVTEGFVFRRFNINSVFVQPSNGYQNEGKPKRSFGLPSFFDSGGYAKPKDYAKASQTIGYAKPSLTKTESFGTQAHTQPLRYDTVKQKKAKLTFSHKRKNVKKGNFSNNLKKIHEYLYQLFKKSESYDLGFVGREKINTKFGISVKETQLTALDIKKAINWLSKLRAGKEEVDDIDHSQNRRVRTSSELIQTQFEVGITRLKNGVTKKVCSPSVTKQSFGLTINGKGKQIKASSHSKIRDKLEEGGEKQLSNFFQDNKSGANNSTVSSTNGYGSNLGYHAQSFFSNKVPFKSVQSNTLYGQENSVVPKQNKTKFFLPVKRTQCLPKLSVLVNFASERTVRKARPFVQPLVMQKLRLKKPLETVPKPSENKTETFVTVSEGFGTFAKPSLTKTESFGTHPRVSFLSRVPKLRLGRTKTESFGLQRAATQNNSVSNLFASEWFSTKPINGALREFFSSSPLSQYMDQTNPLAEITHKRRISSLGIGGVSRESAGMTIRGIHPTHYGRICPIETPEGKNAGLVNSLAFYARVNRQGFIETPYYQVIKGQIQHELGFSFYSAGQESRNGLSIAPNDIKQSKSKLLASNISTVESIPVRIADNLLDLFKKNNPSQVDCIGISPVQILSVATSLIPFLEHNDANRALMGSNMQRQAVSLMISERPLVGTGLEARVLAESGHLVQSKVSGFISNVSAHQVVVEQLLPNLSNLRVAVKNRLTKPKPEGLLAEPRENVARTKLRNKKRNFWYGTRVKPKLLKGGTFLRREKAEKAGVNNASALTDRNLKLNFLQDFLTTKQNFVKAWSAPTEYCTAKKAKVCYSFTKKGVALLPVTHSISTFSRSNQETCLTQKPLVEEGDWVQRGDMLSDCSAGQKGELSVGKNMFIAYIPWQGYNFEDAIVISDRLVKEQLYTSLHIERYTVTVNDFKDKMVDTNEWFTGKLPGVESKKRVHLQKSGLPRIGTILREGDILVGKIKYSKKKPATPHEKLVCDILGEHNFSVQNTSLYVPKGVHEARVLTYKIKKRFEKALQIGVNNANVVTGVNKAVAYKSGAFVHTTRDPLYPTNLRPAGAPKIIHLFLGEKRNIQVGDKMSGRHGNKGIVSTILPKQDMPYLADGSPIDILLNPLGVPSRMNVGQVFECLLGLASTYLHQNFKVTAFDELYGVEASQSLVFLKLYQARLQSGQNWLFQVNFPGKTRLTDGRSGECLDQWITVGRAYMLKLIHMVNEKIHARAIGPYALVTQQPLKGRAHKGGQRLGEMEVWAIEGFGAAYILQELLTKKSDDYIGRKEVLKAMLPKSGSFLDFIDPFGQPVNVSTHQKKEENLHSEGLVSSEQQKFTVLGQPDIFKVLICELQALCLDVGVYSIKTESFQRQFMGILE